MNKSNNKLIKKSNNNINFFIKLKNEVKLHKILYFSGKYFKELYDAKYKRIVTKKLKHFKRFHCVPVIFKMKIKYHIKNLAIDHFKLNFKFQFFIEHFGISPIMQLATLIHLLKCMNIKNLILCITISKRHCPKYDLFCKFLRNILQKYCKDIDIVINYYNSSSCFITKLGAGVNIINEHYATINKLIHRKA